VCRARHRRPGGGGASTILALAAPARRPSQRRPGCRYDIIGAIAAAAA
jgi:hypothetical protein